MKPYFKTENGKLYNGDVLEVLNKLPEKSVNMCITSPPYWSLRNYSTNPQIWDGDENCEHNWDKGIKQSMSGGTKSEKVQIKGKDNFQKWESSSQFCNKCGAWKGEFGLEPSFDLYIKHLADIFDEVKRVLRDDGTCWVNIGDTYGANYRGSGVSNASDMQKGNKGTVDFMGKTPPDKGNIKDKSLVMIPFRFAIEMVNRGWILRNTIIWHKPSCMPSSAKDRFTVDFEYLFLFSKKKKYYFEQQFEELKESSIKRNRYNWNSKQRTHSPDEKRGKDNRTSGNLFNENTGRNKRTVWKIPTKPFSKAHFAVYPERLITTPIKAGCPKYVCKKCEKARKSIKIKTGEKKVPPIGGIKHSGGNKNPTYSGKTTQNIYKTKLSNCGCNAEFEAGTVLDPFMGSGTTGLVAEKLNRKWIGIDLNKEYCEIAKKRIKQEADQEKLF